MTKLILPAEPTPGQVKGEKKKIDFADFKHLSITNARVMVVPIDIDYSESRIHTGSEKKHVVNQGVVVGIGPGFYLPNGEMVDLPYTLGDVVFFSEGVGIEFKVRTPKGLVKVKTVGVESIHYIDGTGHELYDTVDGSKQEK